MGDLFGIASVNEDWKKRADQLCEQLDALNTSIREFPRNEQQHSPEYREWERFVLSDGGVCVAGTATIGGDGSQLRPSPNGWEAYVTAVEVTVSGASNAATVTCYNGSLADLNFFDFSAQMFGGTPSRAIAFYDTDITDRASHSGQFYVEQGDALTYVIAGAVSTATVIVRVSGVRRQT